MNQLLTRLAVRYLDAQLGHRYEPRWRFHGPAAPGHVREFISDLSRRAAFHEQSDHVDESMNVRSRAHAAGLRDTIRQLGEHLPAQ